MQSCHDYEPNVITLTLEENVYDVSTFNLFVQYFWILRSFVHPVERNIAQGQKTGIIAEP